MYGRICELGFIPVGKSTPAHRAGGHTAPESDEQGWAEVDFPRVSNSASSNPYFFDTLVTGMPRSTGGLLLHDGDLHPL